MTLLFAAAPGGWLPHGYCLSWDPLLLWTIVIANAVIGLAYFSIPIALFTFIRRQTAFRFGWILVMFGLFILACGTTHWIGVLNIWYPAYRLDAAVLVLTAGVSLATAIALWPLVPKVLRLLESNAATQRERDDAHRRLADSLLLLEQRHVEATASERRFRLTLASAPIGLALVGLDGRFIMVNQALCAMLGYAEAELLTKTFQDITHPDDLAEDLHHVADLIAGRGESFRMKKRYFTRAQAVIRIQLDVAILRDEQGAPVHFISQIQDITERERSRAQLQQLAHFDALTGLPNRVLLFDRLEQAMRRARRSRHTLAVMFVDIDHFKDINDTRGHAAGDHTLREVARRLQSCVRSSDTVARLGGDEFTIILDEIGSAADAQRIGRKLLAVMQPAIQLGTDPVAVTLSIGAAVLKGGQIEVDLLMTAADAALYEVKKNGRNNFYCVHLEGGGRSPSAGADDNSIPSGTGRSNVVDLLR